MLPGNGTVGVVIENYDDGNIDIHNTDVTGAIENNGFLSFYGDCKVPGTLTNT